MAKKETIQKILEPTGIKLDGDNPWDIKINNEKLYSRVLSGGSLAFGESYMDGWWDSEKLDETMYRIMKNRIERKIITPGLIFHIGKAILINAQNKMKSKKVAEQHYDIGNDFYAAMLDKRMQYTCAYWKNANNLEEAQEHKLDLICRKLQLKEGDKVLEMGGGWGGFAKYAAEKYGCSVTLYNISKEQVKYIKENCKGLPVEAIEADYREAKGEFDKVAAIGMCEHVGHKNYDQIMGVAHRCLKDGGLFMLHTIGSIRSVYCTEPWIHKYIFPNSMLPSIKQLSKAAENIFVIEDLHNFGPDYDKTLMAWYANFINNWPKFKDEYGERFFRMWSYYLLACAGSFRARRNQLWQIVLSKGGVPGGYKSIR